MQIFEITGGKALSGQVQVSGAKNAATAVLAACLLIEGKTILTNVPEIEDVKRMLEIMQSVGVKVDWLGKNKLSIITTKLNTDKMDIEAVCKLRSSILLIGSLISRLGQVKIPYPGGCQIGARSIDAHLLALEKCGFKIRQEKEFLYFEKKETTQTEILLTEVSPTATVNVILATCLGRQKIKILGADYGYSVQELCWFLNKAGAKITLQGSHNLIIEGVDKLEGIEYEIIPDPIETGTFVCLAAATKSDVVIKNTVLDFMRLEHEIYKMANINFTLQEVQQKENYKIVDVVVKPSKKIKAVKRITSMPYPGFMTDLLPPFAVLMTQAQGTSLIHEWMYEDRLKYVNELIKMGANATICDPHRVIIVGPTPLQGQEMEMSDLRAGATLVIAALVAQGKSTISNIYQIDRGYERIDERLRSIGADIRRA